MVDKVNYEKKEVELSRVYPFGVTKDKKNTVLTINELNGFDDEIINKQIEAKKMAGYVQISVSCGITYDESLMLANKDSGILLEAIQGF